MSDKDKLFGKLPNCPCFTESENVLLKCCGLAKIGADIARDFALCADEINLCGEAMPYLLDLVIISAVTHIAKRRSPDAQYGTDEMEQVARIVLNGLEARVLEQMTNTYAEARKAGVTQEVMDALREDKGVIQ